MTRASENFISWEEVFGESDPMHYRPHRWPVETMRRYIRERLGLNPSLYTLIETFDFRGWYLVKTRPEEKYDGR